MPALTPDAEFMGATAYVEPLAVLTLLDEPGPKWKQARR